MSLETQQPDEEVFFNGLDGATGSYAFPPMSVKDLALQALKANFDKAHFEDLLKRKSQDDEDKGDAKSKKLAVKEGVDPLDLSQTGWGVIFAKDTDPAIRRALEPLLELRVAQANAKGNRYKEYEYEPNDSKQAFLNRNLVGPGPVNPDRVPYYLLIVGDPESIPFRFQYQLDVQYAVGRIHFDEVEDYRHYANSVACAESGKIAVDKRAAFFGPARPDDRATDLSARNLVDPLALWAKIDQPSWSVDSYLREHATKKQLASLLNGPGAPALLFTASHGMSFPDRENQLAGQGALLCYDWPGPVLCHDKPIPGNFFFSAADLEPEASLAGMITMNFACYSAGTPRMSDYLNAQGGRVELTSKAFISRLPQKLLSHPRGGALAVIGHVDRAWGYSFQWGRAGKQLEVFQSTLKRLMEGHTVGHALEFFNSRYAELSSDLSSEIDNIEETNRIGYERDLSGLWAAHNDARAYTIIGDPAVRLPWRKAENEPSILRTTTISRPPDVLTPADSKPITLTSSKTSAPSPPNAQESFRELLSRVAASLQTIEVCTYATSAGEVKCAQGSFEGTKILIRTRIGSDGKTDQVVPEGCNVDDSLWRVHSDLVGKILQNRSDILKLAASTLPDAQAGT